MPFFKKVQKDPCLKHACAIQKCLQANSYSEDRCEDVFRAMRKCCEIHTEKNSECCAGFTKQPKSVEEKPDQTEPPTK
ncbi:cx9C motif-containing protein 4 isoform 1-T2 [Clarias gariepinus]|uniref:cx9C motif-containing protein 4 n=1 Tax=Clarias gariepinus TaxID=13013 RepID=UPI00234CE578|nr:cx9C motif-containing protein 4 [Clarias gariepinus]XP_053334891.1 cx9C motif-containing protein 4 [Clarias gariepinus]